MSHFNDPYGLAHGLNPHSLINLRQMLRAYLEQYVAIGTSLQSIKDNLGVEEPIDGTVPPSVHTAVLGAVTSIMLASAKNQLHLRIIYGIAKKIYERYTKSTPTYRAVNKDVDILETVLNEELESRLFFFAPHTYSDYFSSADLMEDNVCPSPDEYPWLGESIRPFIPAIHAFPSILRDIEEAGNCIALDRNTACVFHLMRVMEVALKVVAKDVNVPFDSDWGRCIAQLDNNAKVNKDQFYKEAVAYLMSIKNVFRNPTMHVERSYDAAEAKHVFNATEVFMVHLATRPTEVISNR